MKLSYSECVDFIVEKSHMYKQYSIKYDDNNKNVVYLHLFKDPGRIDVIETEFAGFGHVINALNNSHLTKI